MPDLPFDLATVDWVTVAIYAGIAFLSAIIGNAIALGNRFAGAVLTALFFAIFYVLWVYWLAALVFPPAGTPPV
ncbi:MAG TPA: hypothetical protein VNR88_03535 [Hyphomicrobium sp.]|nr:hypothetical protein [Hyphomicrobium sp.]